MKSCRRRGILQKLEFGVESIVIFIEVMLFNYLTKILIKVPSLKAGYNQLCLCLCFTIFKNPWFVMLGFFSFYPILLCGWCIR